MMKRLFFYQSVEMSKGLTNKELARFADQINALCDKYLRK